MKKNHQIKSKKLEVNRTWVFILFWILGLALFITFVYAIPLVDFINPTPANNIWTTNTSIIVNTSINENNLADIIWNFNNTNYTFYGDTISLFYNGNNTNDTIFMKAYDAPMSVQLNLTNSNISAGLILALDLNNQSMFGENSTFIADLSGRSNNGTPISGAFYNSSGKYGGGYQFDGLDDYISVSDSTNLNPGNITIAGWVYGRSYSEGGAPLVAKGTGGGGEVWALDFPSGNGQVRIYFWKGGSAYSCSSNITLSTNQWYYVVGSYNGTTLALYINGILDINCSQNQGALNSNTHVVSIGSRQSASAGYDLNFNGTIDGVRIWSRSLSAAEIYQQYTANAKANQNRFYLYINQSKNTTAGLSDGRYSYQIFATNSSGSLNSSDLRTLTIDATYPRINFTNPTPANATITSNTSLIINTSIIESNINSIIYNWNGTNYTIYNDFLVLMMNFDNQTSLGENATYVVDVSKFGNNGTVINGTLWNSSGKYGGAYQFDGVDDFIQISDNAVLKPTGAMAIQFWYKSFSSSRNKGFIEKRPAVNTAGFSVQGADTESSKIECWFYVNSGWRGTRGIQTISPGYNQWHHYTCMFNGSTISAYVDGVFDNSTNYVGAITTSTDSLRVGYSSTGLLPINGSIDEVRIWNRSLSADEIYEQYVSNLQKFNQTQWYLYVNQSKNVTAGLDTGTYTYKTFASDLSNNFGQTDFRTLNIDTNYPQINFINPTPVNYFNTTNTNVEINVSIFSANRLSSLIWNFNNTNYTVYNDSLILMYNFDNRSALGENATYVVDNSRYGNNGTVNGSTWNSSGKYNGAYQFDGVNDYIRAPLVTNKIANVTISAWFKTNKYNQAGQMIVYVGSDAAANGYGFAVNQEATTDGTFYALYGGVAWYDSGRDITDSNWHHGVLVINSTGKPNLYLDGAFIYSSATGAINTPTLYTEIGRNDYPAARYFNGSIDEVRIWNRSLSANEVYEQYVSNLQKFNQTQWYFYVNQSKNATTGLDVGTYSYQMYVSDSQGNFNLTELMNISITPIIWPQININWIYPITNINVTQLEWFNISINISCLIADCTNLNVTLDPFINTVYNFTTCGASGRTGPNQTQCNTNYSGTTLDGLVNVGNGIQNFTIPATGLYKIETVGAAGGLATSYASNPGRGAYISGNFYFIQGQVIKILVGQKGSDATQCGGGGGGSFVVSSNNDPLIIAGGGGGPCESYNYRTNNSDANISFNGRTGQGVGAGAGGTNGNGGGANANGASGGGGFYGNGTDGYSSSTPGIAFISNGSGGAPIGSAGAGGFGGGGGSEYSYYYSGAGGGGYSGGGGGYSASYYAHGGGGGSLNNGTNQIASSGNNTGNGYVLVTYLGGVKNGIISMNSSTIGFYTNITNPYNLSLSVNESTVITWWVNATGSPNIINSFFVYANLTSNLSIGNQTSKLNITILDNVAPVVNITYPLNMSYNYVVNSINYSYSDYSGNGYCWYSNSSGVWNSSSVIAGVNFTNVSSVNGNNIWTVYCNDSSGNLNSSTITFAQRIPTINLTWIYPTVNTNATQLEWFNVSVNISCLNGNCGEINVSLDPIAGGTMVEIMRNNATSAWGSGSSSVPDPINTWYHDSRVQSIYLASDLRAAGIPSGASIRQLYFNISSLSGMATLEAMRIRINHTLSNTTSAAITSWNTTAYGPINILRTSLSVNQLLEFNFTNNFTWDGFSNILFDFSRDAAAYTSGGGLYAVTGLQNGRSFGGVSDSGYVWPFDSMMSSSYTVVPKIWLTYSGGTSSKGGLISTNSSATPFWTNVANPYNLSLNEGESSVITWTVNATGTTPNLPYEFFVYANASINSSISSVTSKLNITIRDYVSPIINITYPMNNQNYTFNLSTINYTYLDYSGNGYCWYSNSSGVWNSSISSSSANGSFSNVRTLDGWNNFTVYCNDSSGNLANSSLITFFRDAIYPIFSNYGGNNATMNGSGIVVLNVTILNTNGTVFLEINGSNYTANNISATVWNYSLFLTNGTYAYRWHSWGNYSLMNYNVSRTLNYTLYGNLRIINVSSMNISNVSGVAIAQGNNVTVTTFVENAVNVFLKIWRTFIGGQILWQGFMTNTIGNLWSITLATNSTFPVGEINYTVYANDSLRYQINMSGTFNVTDTTIPIILLLRPQNNTFTNNATVYFSANSTDNYLLSNATLFIWNSTNSNINITTVILTGSYNITNISVNLPYNDRFKWNYYSCDNSSNCAWNNTNWTITYDSISPVINITYPTNTTLNVNVRAINYTYLDTNGNGSCWFSNSSGIWNSSAVIAGINFTNVNSTEGSNTWHVYCNDSANNINSSSVVFVKDTPQLLIEKIYPLNNTNVSANSWFNVIVNVSCFNANCGNVNVTLDPIGTVYNFTTCGASGRTGPNQTQCNANYTGTSLAGQVIVSGGIQNWTVPETGYYTVQAAGAAGIYSTNWGRGVFMRAKFYLVQGQVIKILVGQKGAGTSYGAGGGTFVVTSNNTPLIVSGGGAGGYSVTSDLRNYSDATTNTSGNNCGGACSSPYLGGVNGSGGYGNSYGGGGGFYTDGGPAGSDRRGRSFLNGGAGGYDGSDRIGGFGGGGSTLSGGGGYSGGSDRPGGGDVIAGGGGSYIDPGATEVATSNGKYKDISTFNGVVITNLNLLNNGFGYVTITFDAASGKGGTISMNSSATPFWTNVTNPYNLSLNEGESSVITWTVNASGSFGNTYEFFVYGNLTADTSLGNQTSKWNVTISNITIDLTAPTVNLISPANDSGSNNSNQYFYANFTDNGGLINYTFYLWNSSNSLINLTFANITGIFNETNLSITLPYENAFKWNYYSCDNSSNCGFASNNYTRYYDITPPYFINFSNLTTYSNVSVSLNISAGDNIRFGSYAINWTSNLAVNATNGVIRNISALGLGDYYVNITINDTANNINSTVILIKILNATDSNYPLFSDFNIAPENGSQYSLNQNYNFNVTILNSNGTAGISFNGTNYTLSNVSTLFNKTLNNLAGGTYLYYFWAYGNGTRNLYNKTANMYYTITQNNSAAVYLYINYSRANFTLEGGNYALLNATVFNAVGGVSLYKDGVVIGSGINSISNNTLFNSSGIFNITGIYASNNNYTANSETWYVNVTPPPVGALVNLNWIYPNSSTNVSQNNFFNVSVNLTCLEANCQNINTTLYYDTGCIGTATYNIPVGTCNASSSKSSSYLCSKSQDNNFGTSWFSLGQATPEYIYWDLSALKCISAIKVYPYLTYSNQVVNVDVSENGINWTRVLTSWNLADAASWNENISFDEVSARYVRVNFTSTPTYASVAEIQIKSRNVSRGTISMNLSATPFWTNVTNPYNLTLNVNESRVITWWVNATGSLNTTYKFHVYANITNNLSVSSQTNKINITLIDTTAPTINIIFPQNISYSFNVSSINYTYTEANGAGYCWFSNSSGIWNSSIVLGGTNFSNVASLDNSNTWTVYCNDSFGNLNSVNVTFSKKIPRLEMNLIYPTSDISVNKSAWFNVSVNISCWNGNCGEINVSLDPIAEQYILRNASGTPSGPNPYSYIMGYEFKPTESGKQVRELCNYAGTSAKTVKLYNGSYYELASSSVGTSSASWECSQLNSPVDLTVGNTYFVVVCLAGSGGYSQTISPNTPRVINGINITRNIYQSSSGCTLNGLTGISASTAYGLADIGIGGAGKGGLVSTSSSATPFWTNVTNPYNLTLNVNESRIITWWVNATGTIHNNYTFFVYANLTSNLAINNISSKWNVTITNGTINIVDNNYPIFSNYSDNNGLQAGLGIGYFNVTLNNTNGTVWLNINNTNITATNLTFNVYNVSYNFTQNKTYSYRWYAYGNGNLTRLNNSELRNYTVRLADTIAPRITILSPLNISYRNNAVNLSISLNENASWCGYSLDNSANVSMSLNSSLNAANYTNLNVGQGSHIITFSCNDTSGNMNSSSVVFLLDNVAPQISFSYPTNTSYNTRNLLINISTNSDAANIWFNRGLGNETYTSAVSKIFNEGSNIIYAYANDSLGNLNSTNVTFIIDSLAPTIAINSPLEQTYTTNNLIFNISTNENSSCWFALNSSNNYSLYTENNMNFNYSLVVDNGFYSAIYYCNDSLNNLATRTVSFGVDAIPPQISLNSPVLNGYYNNLTVLFNYTPMASDGLDTCELWGNWTGTWSRNDSNNTLLNFSNNYFTKRLNEGTYTWNVWCNNTNNFEDWSMQGNITFTLDNTQPYVAFVLPINSSYNSSIISIAIANNSDASKIWWFNGTHNNSYTTSIDINLADGAYSFIAYANDSAGNLNYTSVNFTVDTSYPLFFNNMDNNASLVGRNNSGDYGGGIGLFNISINNTNSTVWLRINNTNIPASNLFLNVYNANHTFITEGIYEYYWVSYSNGTSHMLSNSESYYYTINVSDNTSPNIILNSPENNSYSNISSINFTVNLSDATELVRDTESGIKNATLHVYNSSNNLINQTTLTWSAGGTITATVGVVVNLVDGIYRWFYNLFDFAGNFFSSINNTLTLDSTAPAIAIISPPLDSETNNNQIGVSYSLVEVNRGSCWFDDFSYSTNNYLDDCGNITNWLWADGQHNVTIWSNDSAGNLNSSLISFTVDSSSPEVSLNSPADGYSSSEYYTTEVIINCSATDNFRVKNISLYITNYLNQDMDFYGSIPVIGTSGNATWTLNLGRGTYSWNCFASDNLGNSKFAEANRSLIFNFSDDDDDTVGNSIDKLKGNENSVVKSGISRLNITVGVNSTYGSYDDVRELLFFNATQKIMNFTFNFTNSTLDLSKIRIIVDDNYVLVNLSGQLQIGYKKTLYISDNNFIKLCVKNAEINNISNISSDCNLASDSEFNFDSCLGNSVGVVNETPTGNISCYDDGTLVRVEGLDYSAIRGTPAEETSGSSGSSGGGGGGGGSVIINETFAGCKKTEDCSKYEYCFENKCYKRECQNNDQCSGGLSCFDYRCVKLFDVKILDVESPIDAGSFISFTYFLKAMAEINNDVVVNFWIEQNGEEITSGKDTIFIGNMEEKTEKTKIYIPQNIKAGVYDFFVSVTYEKYSAQSHRQIEIDEKGNVIINKRGFLFYILPILLIVIILFAIVIIKLERRKIKDFLEYEREWFLTHKLSIFLLYGSILTLGAILGLGFFKIIELPLIQDYLESFEIFFNYIIKPYISFIISISVGLIVLSIALRRFRRMRRETSGIYIPLKKKNHFEHILKKIARHIVRRVGTERMKRKIRQWEDMGYDIDLIKKEKLSEKEQIKEWKKKGYDADLLENKISTEDMSKQIKEWKKKGYDTQVLKDKFKNK